MGDTDILDFYSGLAGFYDMIFPRDQDQLDFVRAQLHSKPAEPTSGRLPRGHLLDVGCATGTLLADLCADFQVSCGLDLEPNLLQRARAKMPKDREIHLMQGNMVQISDYWPSGYFNAVTCLGNTLPHLGGMRDIRAFIKAVWNVLNTDGVFIVQLINYDRVILQQIRQLPKLENGCVRFERYYSGIKPNGKLDFTTVLSVEPDAEMFVPPFVQKNSVELFPVTEGELSPALVEAGFRDLAIFGNFAGVPFSRTTFLLVAVCRK